MDAQTISVLALAISAIAACGSILSARAALRSAASAGRHRVAEFRQAWIITNIETISELAAIFADDDPQKLPEIDQKHAAALLMKLKLMLNPEEAAVQRFIEAIDKLFDTDLTEKERSARSGKMVEEAHKILKAEWVRIKDELQ